MDITFALPRTAQVQSGIPKSITTIDFNLIEAIVTMAGLLLQHVQQKTNRAIESPELAHCYNTLIEKTDSYVTYHDM